MTIFQFLDYAAFLSVWYWALVILLWTFISHHTFGVPYDLVQRADRLGGQHEADCDELAMIQARRIARFTGKAGPWIAGAVAFLLTVLATLGFWYGLEMARAIFMILAPACLAAAYGVRLAGLVLRNALQGDALRKAIARRRWWDQVIGAVAITIMALMTGWQALVVGGGLSAGAILQQGLLPALADWF